MKYRLAASLALLWPVSASAHLVSTRFGELYSGMLHPLLAPEHILPWLGLGLLGALAGRQNSRWALALFPAAVFAGVLAGTFGPDAGVVEQINLASLLVLGAPVVANLALPRTLFLALAVAVGLAHGYGNAAAELSGNALLLYATGVMLAAYFVAALVTAGAYALTRRPSWGHIAVRAAGSWIVAIGIVFGGFRMLAAA